MPQSAPRFWHNIQAQGIYTLIYIFNSVFSLVLLCLIYPGCFRDGEMHDFGVYWYTKDCLRCYCTREVVSCCNIAVTPVGYDQEKCESVFDVESCSYQVRGKVNPLQSCEVESWVI
uniref:Beta-microseminoprotein n=1 Tax=Terrapene triunguis TaxID=2587831 RepID=A0A674K4T4_9SAUR